MLRTSFVLGVSVLAVICAACTTSESPETAASAGQAESAATPSWLPLFDTCLQVGAGAAAVEALQASPHQHLKALVVDGDLETPDPMTIHVTTGNDQDGYTTRVVSVTSARDANGDIVDCTATKIDGHAPTAVSSADTTAALVAIVDPCTGASIAAVARGIARRDFHLYNVKLTSGSLTQSGDLTYAIIYNNDESGGDDYTVRTTLTLDAAGQSTCKITDVDG